jgi:hypothetical protein
MFQLKQGIVLLSAPGKVLNRVLLERIKKSVDKKLQSLELNSSVYITFIDFEKAFDSLDREIIWKLMRNYGIPEKIITLVKNNYGGINYRVVHEEELTDSFELTTGCLLSLFLFLLAVDKIMRQATEWKKMESSGHFLAS